MSPLAPVPLPPAPVRVRPATPADLPFVDALQKRHAKAVGWMPTRQLAGKIEMGQVLVAEGVSSQWSVVSRGGQPSATDYGRLTTDPPDRPRVAYLISSDRYFKRDDVGIVYQMNVVPAAQRGLVGATLLKAAFDQAAYGCKLFCCWCAQDLPANRFWEAMGFVPLAFRTGGETKGTKGGVRTHIFWQKRIRAGDVSTPWWFPAKTDAGALREDRVVLPIPPGVGWADEMPVLLPAGVLPAGVLPAGVLPEQSVVSGPLSVVGGGDGVRGGRGRKLLAGAKGKAVAPATPRRPRAQFGPPSAVDLAEAEAPVVPTADVPTPVVPTAVVEKPKREKRRADPKLVAAARELRDRWLERVNDGRVEFPTGKYDVTRAIAGPAERALPAAGTPAAGTPAAGRPAASTTRALPAAVAA